MCVTLFSILIFGGNPVLSHNRLEALDLRGLKHLTKVSLSHNALHAVPDMSVRLRREFM